MKRFLVPLICAIAAVWLLPACGAKKGSSNLAAQVEALKGSNTEAKANALTEIAQAGAGAASAVPQVTEALKDADPTVRRLAAYALYEIGLPAAQSALPELRKLLNDGNRELVLQVLNTIRKLDPTGPEAKMAIPNVSSE